MIEKIDKLLPIGTVVRLKEGKKRLMIFGIKQLDGEPQKIEYDYVGVIYPEGNMGLNSQFLFNHSDIEEIYFKGFDDFERQNFMEKLKSLYSKEK